MKNIAVLLMTKPQNGGEHQYLELMMDGLLKENRKKYYIVAICCNNYWRKWCVKNNVNYEVYQERTYELDEMKWHACHPNISALYHMFYTRLCKMITKKKIQILICGQQGIFLPKLPCKIICLVHDLMHRYEGKFAEIATTYEVRETIFSWVSKIADVIIVESELGKRQFIESYLKRKNKQHIEILPYVVSPHIRDLKEEQIDIPDKYIFYPAQFWSHKNHINLVKAVEILSKNITDVQLILVGSEKNTRVAVESYIKEHGLENHIHILGFIKDEQITYLYKHAIAMIMPTYFGPTNLPPLEAMALGCPAIVSNRYAMPEQLGEAGLFFDPDSPEEIAEQIKKVWINNDLRLEMIERGYQRITQWTNKDFEEKLLKIVLNTLKAKSEGEKNE